MKSDADLLDAYANAHDENAFGELVQKQVSLVYSTALRLANGDTHLAQDITQTVFIDLARKSRALAKRFGQGGQALGGWLYTSTRFAATTAIRRNQRRLKYEEKAAAIGEERDEGPGDWESLRPVLDEVMQGLSIVDRDAVILRFFQMMPVRAVGEVLGLSEDAARMRIQRALERLHKLLVERGVTASVTAIAGLISGNALQAVPPALSTAIMSAASGATMSSGLAWLSFMTTTKLKTAIAAGLILAGTGMPLILQQHSLRQARAEKRVLAEANQNLLHLSEDNQSLSNLLSKAQSSEAVSRSQLRELMRLRAEVGALRKDSQELAALRAKGKTVNTDPQPVADAKTVLPAEQWANVGMATPDTALQTFFWAARHGDSELVRNLIRWEKDQSVPEFDGLEEIVASLIPGTMRFAKELEGMTMVGTPEVRDGQARVRVEVAPAEGKKPIEQDIIFVEEEGLWKPLFNVWSPEKGSIRGGLASSMKGPAAQQ
jgi:RNA polymerase sigma factor (sigma-70 family)